MVCGVGKTVELLYKIKSDYGVKMEWLHIMLGSLYVFLKSTKITFFKDDDLGQCRFYHRVQGVVEKPQLCCVDAKRHN